jgi:2-succinyl-5-enolpyruvyl-6-hydroxy-3-cyclohexene-1-carboxylate synthase
MLHPKQHITDLSEICCKRGIKYIVISPGSRNAPLIEAFYSSFGDRCISIVDERSAAYFALGVARFIKTPVALVCTSGTAVLNYGPALAEAYYARVPLLVITADRPAEWIDQQDNQTIRQRNVFQNYVLKSFHLPEIIDNHDLLQRLHQQIDEAIETTLYPCPGPVHINMPVLEPLYESLPSASNKISYKGDREDHKATTLPQLFITQWKNARRIMIIHGLDYPGSGIEKALKELARDPTIVIIAENISNVCGKDIISTPELLLANNKSWEPIAPDLILYSGGQVVSKRIKQYLRGIKEVNVWRIGLDNYAMDTFKQNNQFLTLSAGEVYSILASMHREQKHDEYKTDWLKANDNALRVREKVIRQCPFSDLAVFHILMNSIPSGAIVELGNSTPVRYAQFFDTYKEATYYGNRGVSGIDGCLSSAAGTAFASGKITISIVGDLSFVYDSNALWNRRLPANLRIIVINNGGGGIFSLLDGPALKASFTGLVKAYHPVDIQKLAEAFYLDYFCISDQQSLIKKLPLFFEKIEKAKVMEIRTCMENNDLAYKMITGKLSSDNK